LMGEFYKQWQEFIKSMEAMGKKLDDAKKEFEKLTTTRRNKLEKPLQQIDTLREQSGLKLAPLNFESSDDNDFQYLNISNEKAKK